MNNEILDSLSRSHGLMSVQVRMKRESIEELMNSNRITNVPSNTLTDFVVNEPSNASSRKVMIIRPDDVAEMRDLGTKEISRVIESNNYIGSDINMSEEELGVAYVGDANDHGDKSNLATFRRCVNESLNGKNKVNLENPPSRPDLETFTSLFKKHLLKKSIVANAPGQCDVQGDLEKSSELTLPSIDLTVDEKSEFSISKKEDSQPSIDLTIDEKSEFSILSKKEDSPIKMRKKSSSLPNECMKMGPRKNLDPRITRPVHGFPSPLPRALSESSKSRAFPETSIPIRNRLTPNMSEKILSHHHPNSSRRKDVSVVGRRLSDWNLPPSITVSKVPVEDTKVSLRVLAEALKDISDNAGPTRKVQINVTDSQIKALKLLRISVENVIS